LLTALSSGDDSANESDRSLNRRRRGAAVTMNDNMRKSVSSAQSSPSSPPNNVGTHGTASASIDSGIVDHLMVTKVPHVKQQPFDVHNRLFNCELSNVHECDIDVHDTTECKAMPDDNISEQTPNVHRNLGHSLLGACTTQYCRHLALSGVCTPGCGQPSEYEALCTDIIDDLRQTSDAGVPSTLCGDGGGQATLSPLSGGNALTDGQPQSVCVLANVDDW
jgi:hypothetical protein